MSLYLSRTARKHYVIYVQVPRAIRPVVGHARANTREQRMRRHNLRARPRRAWILTLAGTYREDRCKANSSVRSERDGESIHIFIVHLEQDKSSFWRHLNNPLTSCDNNWPARFLPCGTRKCEPFDQTLSRFISYEGLGTRLVARWGIQQQNTGQLV